MQVTGKWNRRTYTVERLLGEGANGRVYLVRRGRSSFAMKVGSDTLDLQSEINALKALGSNGGLDPYFIESDDADSQGSSPAFPYYVMRYINGMHIVDYVARHGADWFEVVSRRLLERLQQLHRQGYIFGDLKRDNVMVSGHGHVELVDFGGVTRKGKAVRQFTEHYDRGYWNAGGRKADEGYDLFAFALLCIQCTDPAKELDSSQAILPQYRSPDHLKELLKRCRLQERTRTILRDIIDGKLHSTDRVLKAWRGAVLHPQKGQATSSSSFAPLWMKGALLISILLFIVSLLWTVQ